MSSLYPAPQARTWSHVHEGSEDQGLQRMLCIQRGSHMSAMPPFQEIHNSQGRILANLFLWKFITIQLVNQKTNFLKYYYCLRGEFEAGSFTSVRLTWELGLHGSHHGRLTPFCIRNSLYLGWDITAELGQQESRLLSEGTLTSSQLFLYLSTLTFLSSGLQSHGKQWEELSVYGNNCS